MWQPTLMSPSERTRLQALLRWLLISMHRVPDPVLREVLKVLEGIQYTAGEDA